MNVKYIYTYITNDKYYKYDVIKTKLVNPNLCNITCVKLPNLCYYVIYNQSIKSSFKI